MPQAVKRYYGSASAANTHNLIYTCPSNTVARVRPIGLVLQAGFVYQHTTTSTSATYKILGQTNAERAVWQSLGEYLAEVAGSGSGAKELFPIAQYGQETGTISGTTRSIRSTNYSTSGSNTVHIIYAPEWYISAGQKLYVFTDNYTSAWDFLIIEEAGSGT